MDIARARDERDLIFHTDCDAVAQQAGDDAERRWIVRHVSRSDVREAHELAGAARRSSHDVTTTCQNVSVIRGALA
jgi:3-methyladenine DNA glycosylase AlkC